MDKPVAWGLMISSFAVSLLSLVFIAALMLHFSSDKPIESKYESANGVVTNIWVETDARLDVLRSHNVKYLFVDVGGTDANALLTTPNDEIIGFLSLIRDYERRNDYDFILLPYSEVNAYQTDISLLQVRENYISEYKRLYSLGFDGMLVDIEPVRIDQRQDYLDLLDSLNEELGDDFIVAVYANAMEEDKTNEWVWPHSFYSRVAQKADIISASGYDTDSVSSEDYRAFIIDQVGKLSDLNYPSILFAVPTHKPYPEQIGIALDAYSEVATKMDQSPFLGLTVFAEWTATPSDWDRFAQYVEEARKKWGEDK